MHYVMSECFSDVHVILQRAVKSSTEVIESLKRPKILQMTIAQLQSLSLILSWMHFMALRKGALSYKEAGIVLRGQYPGRGRRSCGLHLRPRANRREPQYSYHSFSSRAAPSSLQPGSPLLGSLLRLGRAYRYPYRSNSVRLKYLSNIKADKVTLLCSVRLNIFL